MNEKIEGFYDVCRVTGFTGAQGVMIPKSNVRHLVLRDDVIEAIAAGQFHVYPVATIDEGIALLSGRPANGEEGVNKLASERLRELAHGLKEFAATGHNGADETKSLAAP